MNTRSAEKTTAGLAIAGAVVALVANGIAPRLNGDDVDVYRRIAHSNRFAIAGVLVLLTLVLVTAAFHGLSRIDDSLDNRQWLDYARLATVIGGAVALAQAALELYGYRQEARAFDTANAHNIVSAFWATNALDHANAGLMAMWTILLLGVAPVLLGRAQMRTANSAWLPSVAILGGVICIVVGVAELLKSDHSPFDVPFAIGSVLVTVWLLVTGIRMWRHPMATASA
jgi:Domain of unknown function (DUF4386)